MSRSEHDRAQDRVLRSCILEQELPVVVFKVGRLHSVEPSWLLTLRRKSWQRASSCCELLNLMHYMHRISSNTRFSTLYRRQSESRLEQAYSRTIEPRPVLG